MEGVENNSVTDEDSVTNSGNVSDHEEVRMNYHPQCSPISDPDGDIEEEEEERSGNTDLRTAGTLFSSLHFSQHSRNLLEGNSRISNWQSTLPFPYNIMPPRPGGNHYQPPFSGADMASDPNAYIVEEGVIYYRRETPATAIYPENSSQFGDTADLPAQTIVSSENQSNPFSMTAMLAAASYYNSNRNASSDSYSSNITQMTANFSSVYMSGTHGQTGNNSVAGFDNLTGSLSTDTTASETFVNYADNVNYSSINQIDGTVCQCCTQIASGNINSQCYSNIIDVPSIVSDADEITELTKRFGLLSSHDHCQETDRRSEEIAPELNPHYSDISSCESVIALDENSNPPQSDVNAQYSENSSCESVIALDERSNPPQSDVNAQYSEISSCESAVFADDHSNLPQSGAKNYADDNNKQLVNSSIDNYVCDETHATSNSHAVNKTDVFNMQAFTPASWQDKVSGSLPSDQKICYNKSVMPAGNALVSPCDNVQTKTLHDESACSYVQSLPIVCSADAAKTMLDETSCSYSHSQSLPIVNPSNAIEMHPCNHILQKEAMSGEPSGSYSYDKSSAVVGSSCAVEVSSCNSIGQAITFHDKPSCSYSDNSSLTVGGSSNAVEVSAHGGVAQAKILRDEPSCSYNHIQSLPVSSPLNTVEMSSKDNIDQTEALEDDPSSSYIQSVPILSSLNAIEENPCDTVMQTESIQSFPVVSSSGADEVSPCDTIVDAETMHDEPSCSYIHSLSTAVVSGANETMHDKPSCPYNNIQSLSIVGSSSAGELSPCDSIVQAETVCDKPSCSYVKPLPIVCSSSTAEVNSCNTIVQAKILQNESSFSCSQSLPFIDSSSTAEVSSCDNIVQTKILNNEPSCSYIQTLPIVGSSSTAEASLYETILQTKALQDEPGHSHSQSLPVISSSSATEKSPCDSIVQTENLQDEPSCSYSLVQPLPDVGSLSAMETMHDGPSCSYSHIPSLSVVDLSSEDDDSLHSEPMDWCPSENKFYASPSFYEPNMKEVSLSASEGAHPYSSDEQNTLKENSVDLFDNSNKGNDCASSATAFPANDHIERSGDRFDEITCDTLPMGTNRPGGFIEKAVEPLKRSVSETFESLASQVEQCIESVRYTTIESIEGPPKKKVLVMSASDESTHWHDHMNYSDRTYMNCSESARTEVSVLQNGYAAVASLDDDNMNNHEVLLINGSKEHSGIDSESHSTYNSGETSNTRMAMFPSEQPLKKRRMSKEPEAEKPLCCLGVSPKCTQEVSQESQRQLSLDEKFCIPCYSYYADCQEEGHSDFSAWSEQWQAVSQEKPTINIFIANEVLPYWFQCILCKKWRQVKFKTQPDYAFIKNFACNLISKDGNENPCSVEEDPRVGRILGLCVWGTHLSYVPLIKNFPVSIENCNEESLGLYPLTTSLSGQQWDKVLHEFSLLLSKKPLSAVDPFIMDSEEKECVPESIMPQSVYIGLRNVIVATWYAFPYAWLTTAGVNMHMVCRGLIRIYLMSYVHHIIKLLTQRGAINFGVLSPPRNIPVFPHTQDQTVIVVGAGTAGLAAAKHLCNLGIKTTVLEANNRLGGRVCDEGLFPKGAQFLNGIENNIFNILCKQAEVRLQKLSPDPVFISIDGGIISPEAIKGVYLQYGGVMRTALESVKESNIDIPWYDAMKISMHSYQEHLKKKERKEKKEKKERQKGKRIVKNNDNVGTSLKPLNCEQKTVFNFVLNLYEMESRVNTFALTVKYHKFENYRGGTHYVAGGLMNILDKLSESLDIRYNQKVISVSYANSEIEVKTASGEQLTCTKLLLTVPLPILRKELIVFEPRLPTNKRKAFTKLADVRHEKVFLIFPRMFWRRVPDLCIENPKFAIVPSQGKYFQYFIDITDPKGLNNNPTLLTFMTNILWFEDRSEKYVIKHLLKTLKTAFNAMGVEVPEPTKCVVTDWCEAQNFQTSGSCLKVGSSPTVFDEISEPVKDRIFFAGEATCSERPNSVAGAFKSGLRESTRIAKFIHPIVKFGRPQSM